MFSSSRWRSLRGSKMNDEKITKIETKYPIVPSNGSEILTWRMIDDKNFLFRTNDVSATISRIAGCWTVVSCSEIIDVSAQDDLEGVVVGQFLHFICGDNLGKAFKIAEEKIDEAFAHRKRLEALAEFELRENDGYLN